MQSHPGALTFFDKSSQGPSLSEIVVCLACLFTLPKVSEKWNIRLMNLKAGDD